MGTAIESITQSGTLPRVILFVLVPELVLGISTSRRCASRAAFSSQQMVTSTTALGELVPAYRQTG